ncbi:hypothetical protein J7L05_03365 [bacterium]|nr:hypothetical protein [bacterium]
MARAGIPLALENWTYLPLFKSFLEGLGQKVIINAPTNRALVELGSKAIVDETCLPCKIEAGAALTLDSEVDFLFIPRLVSLKKGVTNCPKMIAMPDLLRNRCKMDIMDPLVDIRRDKKSLIRAVRETGEKFNPDGHQVYKAWYKALYTYHHYKHLLRSHLTPREANAVLNGENLVQPKPVKNQIKIALVGHNYNLNDQFTSFDIVSRLRKEGAFVYTPDSISERIINRMNRMLEKEIFWIHERKLFGAAMYYIYRERVDGIIAITSFNCGTSAVTFEFINHESEKMRVPIMHLVVDEHTQEAGLLTRIEAFMSLIKWKRGET